MGTRVGQSITPPLVGSTGATSGTSAPPAVAVNSTAVANRVVDTASFSSTAAVKPTPLPEGQKDRAYDGTLIGADGKAYPPSTGVDNIPAVRPNNGKSTGETIVFVNGMATNKAGVASEMQELANASGANVVAVDNATQGVLKDLLQCVAGTFDLGKNPAVDTLANVVYDKMKAGQPLHLMGYSQGAIITSEAITRAQNRMMLEDGMSKPQVQAKMHELLKVDTVGGGASHFPDGPKYVHYVNRMDPVAMAVGVGNHLPHVHKGEGAKEIDFTSWKLSFNPLIGHDFSRYMAKYQDFNKAYGA